MLPAGAHALLRILLETPKTSMLPAGAPQTMYQAPQQQHSVVGPALLGAGAGFLGGVLLEEAIDRPMGGFGGGWGGGMGGGWGGNDDGNVSAHPCPKQNTHTSFRAANALAYCVTVLDRMHWSLHMRALSKRMLMCACKGILWRPSVLFSFESLSCIMPGLAVH
jgi:hypothetical protein